MDAEIEGSPAASVARLLRDRSGLQRVTNIELFFDLVYVFAIPELALAAAAATVVAAVAAADRLPWLPHQGITSPG